MNLLHCLFHFIQVVYFVGLTTIFGLCSFIYCTDTHISNELYNIFPIKFKHKFTGHYLTINLWNSSRLPVALVLPAIALIARQKVHRR